MVNQHEFVKQCLLKYKKESVDPKKGGQEAHYPAPKGIGKTTIWLTFEDHQIQGLLQSEEYGRCCFFPGHAKEFLDANFGINDWFYLYDLYEKWTSISGSRNGSIGGKKIHEVKDQDGRSIHARKLAQNLHSEKDVDGKSLHSKKIHSVIDTDGKSLHAKKMRSAGPQNTGGGKATAIIRAKKVELTNMKTGEKFIFGSASEAARQLHLKANHVINVANGKGKTHKGYKARYI